jgi:hypothetical protein
MQDSDFVTLCQKYRNKKIFIPMINNAKIKGGGFIVRPSKFKEPYGIPSICAERMNAVFYLSGKYELFPVCGDKMYVDLLKAKLRRAAIASPKFATPPKNFHKFSMLSWEVATEVIPRVVIGSKSANEIIRYKEACLDAKQRFRSYLWRLEAATSSEAWDNKFTVELEKLIKMEIVPETQKIRDQKVEIWEKLFGDTLTSLTSAKVLPPLLGIHLVPGLSFWQILAFSSSTIAYATFKPLVDAWREERKLRRNALFFLLNLSK